MSDYSSTPQLIRTKTGTANDTLYADGATVPPASEVAGFSAYTPANKGENSEIELEVVAVDASGVVQARGSCTFTLQAHQVIDRPRQGVGDPWDSFAAVAQDLTGQELQSLIRVPLNGGRVWIGLTDITNAPAGATDFQIWAKPVAG